jgi:hypothetical protein
MGHNAIDVSVARSIIVGNHHGSSHSATRVIEKFLGSHDVPSQSTGRSQLLNSGVIIVLQKSYFEGTTLDGTRPQMGCFTIFVDWGLFGHFETVTNMTTTILDVRILINYVRCKLSGAAVNIIHPNKNSHQDVFIEVDVPNISGHVVVVHRLI